MTLLEPAATAPRAASLAATPAEAAPHPVDIHIGQQIRTLRRVRGVSQEQLAAKIGVSFQQVQKYENAKNRTASSTLVEIAEALQVAPGFLLPASVHEAVEAAQGPLAALGAAPHGLDLARDFLSLDASRRAALVNVARALADVTEAEATAR